MDNCSYISYESTGAYKKIVTDYLNNAPHLNEFYAYTPNVAGIEKAIENRGNFTTNRQLLVDVLREQYCNIPLADKQAINLEHLLLNNCFTITTAHQPNIFTGPLYFIYKIVHAIKLADYLQKLYPDKYFVPVYYMGSEDADLEELGHIFLQGHKLSWQTKQTGAVGRMKVDQTLVQLIHQIGGTIGVLPHGNQLVAMLLDAYKPGISIQEATLTFVNALFAQMGLLVIIPDNAQLKSAFIEVVTKELKEQFSAKAVQGTIQALEKHYKVQAAGRDINLFYLFENKRERIEQHANGYAVPGLGLVFTANELFDILHQHPERFSPNVILRGVFQETILPNIAFIGGGGELAYWLELKCVFEAVSVPYPVLLLRNSFLWVNEQQLALSQKLGFDVFELFVPADELLKQLVNKASNHSADLSDELAAFKAIFLHLKKKTKAVDSSLTEHTNALEVKLLYRIMQLEKKILRAQKRKFEAEKRQIALLKMQLFPNNGLQERVDNFAELYAKLGNEFMHQLYQFSLTTEQQFAIVRY